MTGLKDFCFAGALMMFAAPAVAGTMVVCGTEPGGTVVVDGVATEMPNIQVCEIQDDGLGTWDGGDGGEWNGGPGGATGPSCNDLLMIKPLNCSGPKDLSNATWGDGSYPVGSGLSAAIYNLVHNSAGMAPSTVSMLSIVLSRHTSDLGKLTVPHDQANEMLVQGLASACENQFMIDSARTNMQGQPLTNSDAIRACFGTLSRVIGEARGDFTGFFTTYIHRLGVRLEDLGVPRVLINWAAPDNSLRLKAESVEAGARCNAWFQEAQANGC